MPVVKLKMFLIQIHGNTFRLNRVTTIIDIFVINELLFKSSLNEKNTVEAKPSEDESYGTLNKPVLYSHTQT